MPHYPNIDLLVDAVAKKTRLSRATASKAVEAVLEAMPEALRGSLDDASSGFAFESDRGCAFLIQEQAQTREQQWSPEFSARLLAAFRDAVAVELDEHRAAGRKPLITRRITTQRRTG